MVRGSRLDPPRKLIPLEVRYWARVDTTGGPDACWPWIGSRGREGYGSIQGGRKGSPLLLAHRLALQFAGVSVVGRQVLHHCDNRVCQNPRHLYLGTQADNMRDRLMRGGYRCGEAHHMAKLTRKDVRRIRASPLTTKTLTLIYDVNRSTINRIRSGKRYVI